MQITREHTPLILAGISAMAGSHAIYVTATNTADPYYGQVLALGYFAAALFILARSWGKFSEFVYAPGYLIAGFAAMFFLVLDSAQSQLAVYDCYLGLVLWAPILLYCYDYVRADQLALLQDTGPDAENHHQARLLKFFFWCMLGFYVAIQTMPGNMWELRGLVAIIVVGGMVASWLGYLVALARLVSATGGNVYWWVIAAIAFSVFGIFFTYLKITQRIKDRGWDQSSTCISGNRVVN